MVAEKMLEQKTAVAGITDEVMIEKVYAASSCPGKPKSCSCNCDVYMESTATALVGAA